MKPYTTTLRKKYIYALVHKKTGRLLLEGGALPIYWLQSMAINRCKLFENFRVKRIDTSKLETILSESKLIN